MADRLRGLIESPRVTAIATIVLILVVGLGAYWPLRTTSAAVRTLRLASERAECVERVTALSNQDFQRTLGEIFLDNSMGNVTDARALVAKLATPDDVLKRVDRECPALP